jgi:hypothetical protein
MKAEQDLRESSRPARRVVVVDGAEAIARSFVLRDELSGPALESRFG